MDTMIQEFFSWSVLGTMAGCTTATVAITQMIKDLGPISRIPTRILSYLVALALLILAHVFTCQITAASIVLCAVNAVVVALAAQGGYTMIEEGIHKKG
jgi:hypothetical protein